MTRAASSPTHYEVLSLPNPERCASPVPREKLKAAYHRALLRHHPDKRDLAKSTFTIDEIGLAYNVLLDPTTRSAYDRTLLNLPSELHHDPSTGQPRSEILDLDELAYDDSNKIWYRGCRCGLDRGYVWKHEI